MLRLEALQNVVHLVQAQPPELAVRAEELFRGVLYADVPDWSRPETSGCGSGDGVGTTPSVEELESMAESLGLESEMVKSMVA